MATAALVPVSEYLNTAYRPDCDYIEGQLQERNMGEFSHSALQGILLAVFRANRSIWNVLAFPELRIQVAADRFRVPDITVLRASDPRTSMIQVAPLLCLEILSPEDRIQRMQERINDYARIGIEHVWLIDPETRDAWSAQPDGSHQHVATEFSIPGTPIQLTLRELFAELDELLSM